MSEMTRPSGRIVKLSQSSSPIPTGPTRSLACGTAFASASGLATYDGTHFTAAAQRTLGASYFTVYDTVD